MAAFGSSPKQYMPSWKSSGSLLYVAVSEYRFGRTLSAFPAKYPLYDVEPWSSAGIRQYVTRNDVILYSVDEIHSYVYIRSVCTRGRNLDLHLSEQSESIE